MAALVGGVENAFHVGDEAAAGFRRHERGDLMDVGDHGEAAVMAEAFLEDLDGVEVRLRSGAGMEFAEEVAVDVLKLVAAVLAFAEVAAVGFGDLGESGVVELVFFLEPDHAKSETVLAGGDVHGLACEPKGAVGEQEEEGGEGEEAEDGGGHGQREAKVCLWWPSRGLMAVK